MTVHNMNGIRKRGGFSLLELLAVVVILGISAAIVVPRISMQSETSRQTVVAHTLKELNSAIEQYHVQSGAWPAALSDLVPYYLPDGVPVSPYAGKAFGINTTTHLATHQ